MKPALDLSLIAARLEGLEETIISKLIDRAQFRANSVVYEPGKSGFVDDPGDSLFELRLKMQEEMEATFGRFGVPEERPFCSKLPQPKRTILTRITCLVIDDFNKISVADDIKTSYLQIVPKVCQDGDDGDYGSSVEHDVYALQAIGRRIHYGSLYVAESKYQGNPQGYRKLIEMQDRKGLMALLTRPEVEERILGRIREKVMQAQITVNRDVRRVIDPDTIVDYYKEWIIPLTKEGEIKYLLQRKADLQESDNLD